MKNDKAPGADGIMVEVLKYACLDDPSIQFLTDIFNSILITETFPEIWSSGIIIPIHKKGDKDCTTNYRGITLLPVIAKVFTSILAERLRDWAETGNKLPTNQFGFRSGHRTVDAIFVLQTLIERNIRCKTPLFCCFVDLQKAFDSINHTKLWKKLISLGANQRIVNTLINMYSKSKAQVCVGGTLSETLHCNQGVRQGCPLSPILFCLYIADLLPDISTDLPGIKIGGQITHGLLYADDAVLLTEKPVHMNIMLKQLEAYCEKWNLSVNTSKTKIMTINATILEQSPTFVYCGKHIEEVNQFKYLGFLVAKDGNLMKGISERISAAKKAYYALINIYRKARGMAISDLCYTFTSLVESVMLYASEIWGTMEVKELETLLLRFCKVILKVPPSCTTTAVYGELGRTPIHLSSSIRSAKYFDRLALSNCPLLTREAFLIGKNSGNPKSFYTRQMKLFTDSNCEISPSGYIRVEDFEKMSFERFLKKWDYDLHRESDKNDGNSGNKLRFYAKIKTDFQMEPYLLSTNLSLKQRTIICRFRTSCHNLQIELGRHQRPYIPPALRVCDFCNVTQDEIHHLFTCKKYDPERKEMFDKLRPFVSNVDTRSESDLLKILFINGDERTLTILSNFLLSTLLL